MLYGYPCVYAVGNEYQIAINTDCHGIAWIECGGNTYRSSEGGLMISETLIHKISLPMAVLDAAKSYRICLRPLPERRPYFPELGPVESHKFSFRPVDPSRPVRMYMLADTHSRVEEPLRALRQYGDIDLLILNGDVPAESKTPEDIRAIFTLTGEAAKGEIPVVFARGNHDYRGRLATELTKYIGTREGRTYFTFRLGGVWGLVLDCGEDKDDTHPEYGGMVDCHSMRLAQTAYIEDVIARADEEYLAPGVTTRLVVTHLPFPTKLVERNGEPFDIERDIFARWTALLNGMKPDIMLCGHEHRMHVFDKGDPGLRFGAEFPVVVGSAVFYPDHPCAFPEFPGASFICAGMSTDGGISVHATDDMGHSALIYPKQAEA